MREEIIDLVIDSYLYDIKEKERQDDWYSVRRLQTIVMQLGNAKQSIHAYQMSYSPINSSNAMNQLGNKAKNGIVEKY